MSILGDKKVNFTQDTEINQISLALKVFIWNLIHNLYKLFTSHENGKQHKIQLRYKLRAQYAMFQ